MESAENAILNIQDYTIAVSQYAQAALRDVIGGIELDALLSEREQIAQEIKKMLMWLRAVGEWTLLILKYKI